MILLVVVENPIFTSFTGEKMKKLHKDDDEDKDDSSSDYFLSESEESCSSSDSYESINSRDLVKELRQENYIWTAIKDYSLSNDPTEDIEEKRLKSYISLTPSQKSHITPIGSQEDQEESFTENDQEFEIQEDEPITIQEDQDIEHETQSYGDYYSINETSIEEDFPIFNLNQRSSCGSARNVNNFSSIPNRSPVINLANDAENHVSFI